MPADAVRAAMTALAAAGPGGPSAPPTPRTAPGAVVFRSRRWRPQRELHVSAAAVVLAAPGAEPQGIALAECVEVRWWHDGNRVLVDRAGRLLAVVYAEWADRERMLARPDGVVPPGLFVCCKRDRAPVDPEAAVHHPVVARLAPRPVRPPRGA